MNTDEVSLMAGRTITYRDRVTPVQLGDHVQTRIWWRRRRGRVIYVPGVSRLDPRMEFNGLTSVAIRLERDWGILSTVVDPKGAFLIKNERLIRRDSVDVPVFSETEDPSADTGPSP